MYGTLPPAGIGTGGALAATGAPAFQVVGLAMIAVSAAVGGVLLLRLAHRRPGHRAET
ncbi:peptidase [Leifsonia sp. C5G2]|uniref:peptidase n=1 Tax=Leifsonia sp. C5G2 TaxID=2735269 RepID=UPI0015856386|nr:peptidase [Leifsonia sp. C5G2]